MKITSWRPKNYLGLLVLKKHVNLKPVASKINKTCLYKDRASWNAFNFVNGSYFLFVFFFQKYWLAEQMCNHVLPKYFSVS